jgi:RNA polymerase sigma-70 factor (ECF subfamily)
VKAAAPALDVSGLPLSPIPPSAKKFQRIFVRPASYELKECRMHDPDEALVVQSQNGDAAAYAELIRKHQRMIHSLAYRMTGSMTEAEDLAQETFILAYRQIATYRGASKFSTWLYRIAINACLGWQRHEKRRREILTEWTRTEECDATAASSNGETNYAPMHAALLKLSVKQRAAVMLTLYDGMNHAQAAEILNCSETTVSWRVFTARRKLKKWLLAKGHAR